MILNLKIVNSDDKVKICKDCKWFYYSQLSGCLCKRPRDEIIDLVNGYVHQPSNDAFDERGGECGKEGKFWEAV